MISAVDDPGDVLERHERIGEHVTGEVAAVDEARVVNKLIVGALKDRTEADVQRVEAAFGHGVGGVPQFAKIDAAFQTGLEEKRMRKGEGIVGKADGREGKGHTDSHGSQIFMTRTNLRKARWICRCAHAKEAKWKLEQRWSRYGFIHAFWY